jgi:hypothetical protein
MYSKEMSKYLYRLQKEKENHGLLDHKSFLTLDRFIIHLQL